MMKNVITLLMSYVKVMFSGIRFGRDECISVMDTTMNPEFRTLRQVTIDNVTEADRVFSMLMGDDVPPRRAFIEANAKYAKIDV